MGNNVRSGGHQMPKASSPPRTAAGHKRKLDALRGPQHERTKQPGPQTAPAVPSFGAPIASLRPTPGTNAADKTQAQTSKKRPGLKSLGLTPAVDDSVHHTYSDSDDDKDIDEEAMHAELGDKLAFEHNGVFMSLNSQADLAAWKIERLKNWPTRARTAVKDEKRRQIGEERKRLLGSAGSRQSHQPERRTIRGSSYSDSPADITDAQSRSQVEAKSGASREEGATNLEKAKTELTAQKNKLDELRRKVAESEAHNRAARALQEQDRSHDTSANDTMMSPGPQEDNVHLNTSAPVSQEQELDYANDHVSEISDESSAQSSSISSSQSASDSNSDNDAPEEITSKPAVTRVTGAQRPLCKYFMASGYCRDGDACRFRHELPGRTETTEVRHQHREHAGQQDLRNPRPPGVQEQSEKKTIFQRLVEQEQKEEDRLALQVIKYLGMAGFFKSPISDGT